MALPPDHGVREAVFAVDGFPPASCQPPPPAGHGPYAYPCSPFGPRRPLFTRSFALPLAPTTLPSLTPMSSPQPLLHACKPVLYDGTVGLMLSGVTYLHSTQALWTHFSGSSSHAESTLVGHSCL